MKLRYLVPVTFALSVLMFWADLHTSYQVVTGLIYLVIAAAFPFFSRNVFWSWAVTTWATLLILLDLVWDTEFRLGTEVATYAVANRLMLTFSMWCITGLMLYVVRVHRQLADRELALRRHLVEMAHTNRLTTIGQMVVELTHEINQPLYAIDNFAKACSSMLRDDTPDSRERAMQWTGQITTQARRASEIIRRLRRFVQSDSPLRATANINDIVRDVIELLEIDPRLRGVRIVTQRTDGLPPLSVDRIQIEQVLVNLLVNAAEASQDVPPEFKKITVATRAVNGDIEVAVRDEGCGMSPAARERLFEPYFSTKADGMGMGLAISRSLIEEHGGRLWADQNRDRGLTFRFTLPIGGAVRVPRGEPAQLETQGANT